MPDEAAKSTYGIWSDRVKVAKEYHKRFCLDHIEEVERVWRGMDQEWRASVDLENIQVNLIYANSKTIVPQIWFTNPEIMVDPLTDRFEDLDPATGQPRTVDVVKNTELVKPVLEQKVEQIGFKREEQKVVRDAYLFGMGIMKEGWGSQYGKIGEKRVKDEPTADQDPADHVQQTPVTGIAQNIMPDQPWFLRCHPKDVWFPSWARSYDEMEFIIHRIHRRVEDVKSDSRYKNTDKLEGTRMIYEQTDKNRAASYEQQEYFVELHEIHYRTKAKKNDPMDKEYEPGTALYKVIVLAEGHQEILYHDIDEIAMSVGHFPFRLVVFSEDPDRIYPNSDVKQVINQQREICKLRSYNLEIVKRQPSKIIYGNGAISDQKQEEQLTSNLPISYIKINDINQIKVLESPGMNKDAYIVQDRLMQDFRMVSGVGENQQGAGGMSTATEASIVQSNLNVRTADMLDRVKDHAIGCFYDLFAMLTEFSNQPEIVRIDGPKGAQWKTWKGSDIRGKYRFRLDITQMQPPNNQVRKKEAFDFMNVAITQPQYFNVPEVVKQVAKTYSDVFPSVDALIREQQEPHQGDETLAMLSGGQPPVEPWHNHAEHMMHIENFSKQPAFAGLNPMVQQVIGTHYQMHQKSLQMMQGGGKAGANPAPQEGVGAVPALVGNKAPTEASLTSASRGGRVPHGVAR